MESSWRFWCLVCVKGDFGDDDLILLLPTIANIRKLGVGHQTAHIDAALSGNLVWRHGMVFGENIRSEKRVP